jgi:hypothetical protein
VILFIFHIQLFRFYKIVNISKLLCGDNVISIIPVQSTVTGHMINQVKNMTFSNSDNYHNKLRTKMTENET